MTVPLHNFEKHVYPPIAATARKTYLTDHSMECAKRNPTAFHAMVCADARYFPGANAIENLATAYSDGSGEQKTYVAARRKQAAEVRS